MEAEIMGMEYRMDGFGLGVGSDLLLHGRHEESVWEAEAGFALEV